MARRRVGLGGYYLIPGAFGWFFFSVWFFAYLHVLLLEGVRVEHMKHGKDIKVCYRFGGISTLIVNSRVPQASDVARGKQ